MTDGAPRRLSSEPSTQASAAEPAKASSSPVRPAGFEDLWWPVGTRVQLVFKRGGQDRLASSTLIGYALGEYLIVRTPPEKGLPMMVEPGESIRLRAFLGTSLGEFDTIVDRVFRAPMWYLHLQYPREVRIQKLRAAPRVKADLAVAVTVDGAPPVQAKLVDLSAHGAQVIVDGIAVEKGSAMTLDFKLDGDEPGTHFDLSTSAKVMTARRAAQAIIGTAAGDAPAAAGNADSSLSLGVRFDALDQNDRLKIANYVYQRLLSGG